MTHYFSHLLLSFSFSSAALIWTVIEGLGWYLGLIFFVKNMVLMMNSRVVFFLARGSEAHSHRGSQYVELELTPFWGSRRHH